MSLFRKWVIKTYIWVTEQLYHRFAWAYDFVAWLVSFGNWAKWRQDVMGYLEPGKILEIGFGTGALLVKLKKQGCEVYGLDTSPQMLTVTRRRAEREGVFLRVVQARAQEIPFLNQGIDNIIATFPSGYIFDENSLKEIKRVLTNDGQVLITGFGVQFNSGLKNWLTSWFLNDGSEFFIEKFCEKTQDLGFKSQLVRHRGGSYTLPIIILEIEDDK